MFAVDFVAFVSDFFVQDDDNRVLKVKVKRVRLLKVGLESDISISKLRKERETVSEVMVNFIPLEVILVPVYSENKVIF